MAFQRLNYAKDWTNPGDFPTYEDSETQVRADLQFHPDAVKTYLNDVLLPALEAAGAAASLGTTNGSVQAVLDQCVSEIATLAGGGVPVLSQCVRVSFAAEDWTAAAEEGGYATLTIGRTTHKRSGAAFGYNLWQSVDGAYISNTWGVAGTQVSVLADNGDITLKTRTPYSGIIVFFGL